MEELKLFFLLILGFSLAMSSCQINESNSVVEEALRKEFPNYPEYKSTCYQILNQNQLIDSSKASFSNLYGKLCYMNFDEKISLTQKQKEKIMIAELGAVATGKLYQSALAYKSDQKLSKDQVNFYATFEKFGTNGLNCDEISKTIENMSPTDFNAAGIRDLSLFFLTHKVLEISGNAHFSRSDFN